MRLLQLLVPSGLLSAVACMWVVKSCAIIHPSVKFIEQVCSPRVCYVQS